MYNILALTYAKYKLIPMEIVKRSLGFTTLTSLQLLTMSANLLMPSVKVFSPFEKR